MVIAGLRKLSEVIKLLDLEEKVEVWTTYYSLAVAFGKLRKDGQDMLVDIQGQAKEFTCRTKEEMIECIRECAKMHGLNDLFCVVEARCCLGEGVVEKYLKEEDIYNNRKRFWMVVVCTI